MTRTVSMSTAINEAMKISMRRDENVILIGEDVAGGAQVDHLQDDEAWGGVLGVTKGLVQEFGRNRIWIHQFLKRVIWELRWQLLQLGYVR